MIKLCRIIRTIIVILLLIPVCAWALDPWGEMIAQHGRYSTLYESDWSTLGDAKQNWDRSPSDYTWKDGLSGLKRSFKGALCELKNIARKIDSGDVGASRDVFKFNGCDKTVIENVAIWFTDKYSFSHTFEFSNSGDVYIKNLYIRGAVRSTHVYVKGGDYVYMNNIEIEGIDYTGDGREENGRGIWLVGGECVSDGNCQTGPYDPFDFFVIQNIYIHDFDGDKSKGNFPEAIGVNSGGDGIVFNCFVEHWTAKNPGETVIMQVMHRRSDRAYGQGHITRVERCKVNDGNFIKQGAAAVSNDTTDNHTIWANNVFNNINFAADFKQDDEYFVNNTWLMSTDRPFRIWNQRRALHIYNNLVYYDCNNCPIEFFKKTTTGDSDDKRRYWNIDYNLYYGHTPSRIWRDEMNSSRSLSWADWQKSGKDTHSKITKSGRLFANLNSRNHQYTLASNSPARAAGSSKYVNHSRPGLRVNRDFFGRTRSRQAPDIGAIAFARSSSTNTPAVLNQASAPNQPPVTNNSTIPTPNNLRLFFD